MYIFGSVFVNVGRCNGGQDHTATHCNTLQHTATNVCGYNGGYDHTARHCNTLQDTATHCNTQQHAARHCKTLQYTVTLKFYIAATHCHTLPHTATQCNKRKQMQWWTRWQSSQRSTSLMMSSLSTSIWRISCTLSWPPRSFVLQHVAVCCCVLLCVAVRCSVLWCVAVCCHPGSSWLTDLSYQSCFTGVYVYMHTHASTHTHTDCHIHTHIHTHTCLQ